jgi:hypothetical protein
MPQTKFDSINYPTKPQEFLVTEGEPRIYINSVLCSPDTIFTFNHSLIFNILFQAYSYAMLPYHHLRAIVHMNVFTLYHIEFISIEENRHIDTPNQRIYPNALYFLQRLLCSPMTLFPSVVHIEWFGTEGSATGQPLRRIPYPVINFNPFVYNLWEEARDTQPKGIIHSAQKPSDWIPLGSHNRDFDPNFNVRSIVQRPAYGPDHRRLEVPPNWIDSSSSSSQKPNLKENQYFAPSEEPEISSRTRRLNRRSKSPQRLGVSRRRSPSQGPSSSSSHRYHPYEKATLARSQISIKEENPKDNPKDDRIQIPTLVTPQALIPSSSNTLPVQPMIPIPIPLNPPGPHSYLQVTTSGPDNPEDIDDLYDDIYKE